MDVNIFGFGMDRELNSNRVNGGIVGYKWVECSCNEGEDYGCYDR